MSKMRVLCLGTRVALTWTQRGQVLGLLRLLLFSRTAIGCDSIVHPSHFVATQHPLSLGSKWV
jgi:hypothetical protein